MDERIQLMNHVKREATDDKLRSITPRIAIFRQGRVRVSHIVIRSGRTRGGGTPPRENPGHRAELAAERRRSPRPREILAVPSALKSGDLGFVLRRGLRRTAAHAGRVRAQSGGLSDVVESDRGFHLVTITDRKPGTPSVLEKCVVEVVEAYVEDFRGVLVKKLRKEGQVKVILP